LCNVGQTKVVVDPLTRTKAQEVTFSRARQITDVCNLREVCADDRLRVAFDRDETEVDQIFDANE